MANEVKWTEEQKQAIYEKNSNILVAAAAGSGKTADPACSRRERRQRSSASMWSQLTITTDTRGRSSGSS